MVLSSGSFMRHFAINRQFWQLLPILVALAGWELIVRLTNNQLVPPPSLVFQAIGELAKSNVLFQDCLYSLKRVVLGFSIAALTGVTIGFCLGLSPIFKAAFQPLIELLRPIPPIAWIPIAIAIFGIGDGSACFVIFIGAFYPIVTNTFLGVSEVSELYLEAAQLLGASRWRILREVIFPAALPSIFAGLRIGLGVAWMCVVAAEMIAARSGLGYEIQLNRQLLQLDRVGAGMVVIGIIGVSMQRLMVLLEGKLIYWRSSGQALKQAIADEFENGDSFAESASESLASASLSKPLLGARLALKHLRFSYPSGAEIVRDLNISIGEGEAFCILGRSGCGKTTILRMLAGLRAPLSGEILIDDQPLLGGGQDVTMVFQSAALFPWLTVAQNLEFALRSRHISKEEIVPATGHYLRLVGGENLAQRYPHQLSAGQSQRIALARALAYRPRLILMDEPFASLDSQTREILQLDVSRLLRRMGISLVLVTHDIREAIFMSDRIGILSPQTKNIDRQFAVTEPRPRQDEFRYRPEFGRLRAEIWHCLNGKNQERVENLGATDCART
jgi:ABC-type nitrate/sulfonate/bicarbonate transport system permease component/ABC-type nitrate/sulfonate/bicarbonate transport system ATPase subunit